jgi:hypothetical protein
MSFTTHHPFHIPVMGLAYTIDSPIKVARFGISSVISIMEDRLIEMMRKHYYPTIDQEYQPISTKEPDFRARRITDYLNLVNTIVQSQVEKLRTTPFEAGSEIVKYFAMLPEDSALKQCYKKMVKMTSDPEKENMQTYLRTQIQAGSIDVNIMTKTDRNNYNRQGELLENGSDAVAALRGYAKSNLENSSVVFSAGMNPRLYNYLENCPGFEVNEQGEFAKKIIVKVSDYRSALIQGKYLAKKGIWVSEFRIESGLNCGGHAFATDGYLMGPVLEEFKANSGKLIDTVFGIYQVALERKNGKRFHSPPKLIFSAQGGIGTHEEDKFLHQQYNMASTGWGTPFLLVPEATTVDEGTLKLLCTAEEKDVVLSRYSPLGIKFHYLKGTSSDKEKMQRIQNGKPGSPCTEKHLAFNTEFTKEPICTASHEYQKLKIAQLKSSDLTGPELENRLEEVLEKECLCVGLSNSAAIIYKQPFIPKLQAVTICPGPNIVNFSRVISLQTMTDHIYGRTDIVTNAGRPHMFIAELHLYIDYLKKQINTEFHTSQFFKRKKYFSEFYNNLRDGIRYYSELPGIELICKDQFKKDLCHAGNELDLLHYQFDL